MKIYQLLPALAYGDAIGNDALAKMRALKESGFDTMIYADYLDNRLASEDVCQYDDSFKPEADDVIIYHLSTGTKLNYKVASYKCRKICVYHNITPPSFYNVFHTECIQNLENGYIETKFLHDKFDTCIADSDFNKQCLIGMGYDEKNITVIPCVIPFEDYNREPDKGTVAEYDDGLTNVVFIGRVVPNKKFEDIIRCFAHYQKNVNERSRLILAGKCIRPQYYNALKAYTDAAQVKNVVFTDGISFESIIAIYKTAHIFLCMSEYEGLCVPLLEAMHFNLPIIAYKCAAIPYTMGNCGLLVDEKDPVLVSELMDRLMNDEEFRSEVVSQQRRRLDDFKYENVSKKFVNFVKDFLSDGKH
ncbi:MAG: glycosyltransferase family 4 protein [Ruminiclostridium sp.]|nr:glycosyltransferase family 4 protein [Ruminiclostridium sp.]